MEKLLNSMRTGLPRRTVMVTQSLEDLGVKRGEDGKLIFPRYSDPRFPVGRLRRRLAAYGWRGERLNQEVARIVAGSRTRSIESRLACPVIWPYGWETRQLTREMRRMFPRNSGRRTQIILDELHLLFEPQGSRVTSE